MRIITRNVSNSKNLSSKLSAGDDGFCPDWSIVRLSVRCQRPAPCRGSRIKLITNLLNPYMGGIIMKGCGGGFPY